MEEEKIDLNEENKDSFEEKKQEIQKEAEKEIKHENKVDEKNMANDFTKKMRENPWMVSTLFLALLSITLIFVNFSGGMTGGVIGVNDASQKVLDFASSQADGEITLVETNEKYGLYEVVVEYQGNEVPLYITKDGENLVQGVIPLSVLTGSQNSESSTTQTQPTSYSEEDLEAIAEVIDCYAEKDVKVYGANWCGYTNAFVETLGGYEVIDSIYVECTEETDLCSEEEIKGYPTTKISGESYSGARTFEGLSQETGCPVPELSISNTASTSDVQC